MSDYLIRPVRPDDAEDINELRRQPSIMAGTLAMPSETVESNRRFLTDAGPNDHLMVAEVAGKVVGMAGLHVLTGRLRNTGHVGIMVHESYRRRGIARSLLEALLDIADNFLGLVRVELDVWSDNIPAIRLYEQLGFEAEGRKRKYAIRGGAYVDALMMARVR